MLGFSADEGDVLPSASKDENSSQGKRRTRDVEKGNDGSERSTSSRASSASMKSTNYTDTDSDDVDVTDDWENSVTKYNLIYVTLFFASTLALYLLYFLQPSVQEYKRPIYYSSSNYDKTLNSFVLVQEEIFTLPLFTLVLAFMTSGTLATTITFVPCFKSCYFNQLEKGRNIFKWFDFCVSSVALNLLVATQFGVGDLNSLIPVAGCSFGSAFLFYLYESVNTVQGVLIQPSFKSPLVFSVMVWFFIWPTFILSAVLSDNTNRFDFGQFPAWMYGTASCALLYSALLWLNELLYFSGCGPWGRRGYEYVEKSHNFISFVTKSTVAWLTYAFDV